MRSSSSRVVDDTGTPTPKNLDGRPDLGDPERALRGLPVEVRTIASYLWARADRLLPVGGDLKRPGVASLAVLAAAVGAVREAIADAGVRGLAPEKLRALHGRLDRAFARLVEDLLERAHRRSADQIRDVSHDLRSPLNTMLLLADALANQPSLAPGDVQSRQAGVLYTAALSLNEWLTDLIEASTMDEAGEIAVRVEPFPIESVLAQVDQLLGALAAHMDVALVFETPGIGSRRGDRRILARVLVNLTSNAIRATPRDGRVRIRVVDLPEGWLAIEVEDGGTDADIQRLRAGLSSPQGLQRPANDRGWTRGLGLSICGRLVQALGGRIDVEGGGGKPCRFVLALPFPSD